TPVWSKTRKLSQLTVEELFSGLKQTWNRPLCPAFLDGVPFRSNTFPLTFKPQHLDLRTTEFQPRILREDEHTRCVRYKPAISEVSKVGVGKNVLGCPRIGEVHGPMDGRDIVREQFSIEVIWKGIFLARLELHADFTLFMLQILNFIVAEPMFRFAETNK